ncbi:type I-E CRISPR-associated protein Cas7/Cse4/CasC [Modicisalibacter sp. 'Wilcox']|uniref:type I-E CRISPR-associated protein Cas7/Cse4/CasC n=1 Tax=Modicisalibacter sp. 'Wilcox' TaxID=2679914 RepID=UPI00079C4554|nr:type I-E CRISPR-associated protein Cas7/Cse4/CasC [Modicisalibacter sp. 'Wilcox']KXS38162.1 MAG: CRISPR-associated protein [Halomonadaceae bacterium T82-2]
MNNPRFLQIHTLTTYPAALLNRDDSGLAKRLPYGGVIRTRISSQCLKRHWRIAEDPHALSAIDGASLAFRSRELVSRKVFGDLEAPEAVIDKLEPEFQKAVYGDKGTAKSARQTLLLGERELAWLSAEARRLAQEANGDAAQAATLAAGWKKDFQKNIKVMREATSLPGGLTGALFGRMVTSDPEANITAPVHVAHAFTVHGEESESDYFTAVDDLAEDAPGADTIQETELTSGLYYGYVVVDLDGLKRNLGLAADDLAGPVLHNLIHLIAEVSPGAKLGSTAPYSRASFMLAEAGDRQPRSLAEAFQRPVASDPASASSALVKHLAAIDAAYATGEERRFLSLHDTPVDGAQRSTLKELAEWAGTLPGRLS